MQKQKKWAKKRRVAFGGCNKKVGYYIRRCMSRREWCASICSSSLLSSYITTVVEARYSYHASGRSVWRFLQAMAAHLCDVELALGSKFEGHVRSYMCMYARLADYWGP